MMINARLFVSLIVAAAFATACAIPPASAAEAAPAPPRKTVTVAPAAKKPAAPPAIKLASRSDPLANGERCSHLGCRDFFLVGVGF